MTHRSRLRTLTAAFSDQPGNRSSWLLAPAEVHPWNRKGELAAMDACRHKKQNVYDFN